jgi:hypothetical protein
LPVKAKRLSRPTSPRSPSRRLDLAALSHVLFMAFDGYSMNHRLNDRAACSDETIELFCDLLLGEGTGRAGARPLPSQRPRA